MELGFMWLKTANLPNNYVVFIIKIPTKLNQILFWSSGGHWIAKEWDGLSV